jgi:dCTP deaminase
MWTAAKIKAAIASKEIEISPYDPKFVQPNSYDVHLADTLLVYKNYSLDLSVKQETESVAIPADGIWLEPGKLYLGATVERTNTPTCVPKLEGVSSMGRVGVQCHVCAGLGDIGFNGVWTLEIIVVQPVKIKAGEKIGQLTFYTPDGEIEQQYSGRYANKTAAMASEIYLKEKI